MSWQQIHENIGCSRIGFSYANVLEIEIHENTGCTKTGFNFANVMATEIHKNIGCTKTGFNSAVLNMKTVILLHSYKAKEDKTGWKCRTQKLNFTHWTQTYICSLSTTHFSFHKILLYVIGWFSEAGLHEWMPFAIFSTRSHERLQWHIWADFWVGVASCCV